MGSSDNCLAALIGGAIGYKIGNTPVGACCCFSTAIGALILYYTEQPKKTTPPQQETSISRKYDNLSLEEKINVNLINWIKEKRGFEWVKEPTDVEIIGNNVWAVGSYKMTLIGFPEECILYSSDKGKTWELQKKIDGNPFGISSGTLKVKFLDEKRGWVATRYRILHTTDRGKNWDIILNPDTVLSLNETLYRIDHIEKFEVVDYDHLRIQIGDNENNLYESFDNGKSWKKINNEDNQKKTNVPQKTKPSLENFIDPNTQKSKSTSFLLRQIENYQENISPKIKERLGRDRLCKYEPSCSEFAKQAIEKYGTVKGTALAGGRLVRCNPWSKGGYDPVT
jgi:putative membrane protein insertion efficiency factor